MSTNSSKPSPAGKFNFGNFLVYCAAFVIVIAGLKSATSILIPVLLAVFIAIVMTPPFFALQRWGMNPIFALTVLIGGLVFASFGMVGLIGSSITEFKDNKDVYSNNLKGEADKIVKLIVKYLPVKKKEAEPNGKKKEAAQPVLTATNVPPAAVGTNAQPSTNALPFEGATNATPVVKVKKAETETKFDLVGKMKQTVQDNSEKILNLVSSAASTVGVLLGNTFLIVLIAIFLLLEAAFLPKKIRNLPGMTDETWARLTASVEGVRSYMGLKTALSLLTGFLCWVVLVYMGVEYAILFGLLAFILNYVPNIGSLIAAVPAVLIAWLGAGPEENALIKGGIVLAGYIVINTVIGNVIEPKVLDSGLGLSASIIVITMVFWGWVLGTVGMLLSVPLTMIAKIALEAGSNTEWIGAMMGSGEEEQKKPDKPSG